MNALMGRASSFSVPLTTAYQVDNMTVILHFLIEIHFYIVAVAGKIVTGEIDQHDMFRILFGIIMQILGVQRILFGISRYAW